MNLPHDLCFLERHLQWTTYRGDRIRSYRRLQTASPLLAPGRMLHAFLDKTSYAVPTRSVTVRNVCRRVFAVTRLYGPMFRDSSEGDAQRYG